MRYLKLLAYSVVFFFLLLTAVGLLFPGELHVSRAIDLPGQQRASLMRSIDDASFRRCWLDSMDRSILLLARTTDSSYALPLSDGTSLRWTFHGRDGSITMQGQVDVRLRWFPWERFKSLLLEPRYGGWLENELEKFRRCLTSAQVAGSFP